VFFAGFSSLFFSISLYLQHGLGLGALATGAATVPFAVGAFIAAGATDKITARVGPRVIVVGALLMVAGLLSVVGVVQASGTQLHALELAGPLFVAGLGCGLVIAPLIEISLAGVPWQQAGAAAGVLNAAQRLGTAIGVALIGVALFSSLADNAPAAGHAVTPALRAELRPSGFPEAAAPVATRHFETCFAARARAHDPTVPPPGCDFGTTAYSHVFAASSQRAVRANFTHAFERATFVNLGAAIVTVALALLLSPAPRRRRSRVSAVSEARS
jgi:hypothetical protein